MSERNASGDAYVRKMLDQIYAAQDRLTNDIAAYVDMLDFCNDPTQYEWNYIGQQDALIPRSCDPGHRMKPPYGSADEPTSAQIDRWELHRVSIVEGVLLRGESNMLVRRRSYLDINSRLILLGDGYDNSGALVRCYMRYPHLNAGANRCGQWYSLCEPK